MAQYVGLTKAEMEQLKRLNAKKKRYARKVKEVKKLLKQDSLILQSVLQEDLNISVDFILSNKEAFQLLNEKYTQIRNANEQNYSQNASNPEQKELHRN